MDIKDWILIGGGVLLVAVIGHGFWLAWRSRHHTLRMDIDPNIPRDEVDPLDLLRAELPNGGARVRRIEPREQFPFDLEPNPAPDLVADVKSKRGKAIVPSRNTLPRGEPPSRAIIPERTRAREDVREDVREAIRASFRAAQQPAMRSGESHAPEVAATSPAEVLVINVLARNGAKFGGSDLLEAFLRNGLKFGDMNIFHRIQPESKEVQFSVASAVEPGTFDLSAINTFQTPGVSFFMRMPGPDQPLEVFEDMLAVTRDVAASLGADLKDEQLSVMTSQTIQHCRSRIEDFSRKRMSQRA